MQVALRRHSTIFAVVSAILLAVILFVLFLVPRADAATADKTGEKLVTVYDRGENRGFITKAATLRQAFEQENINLDKNDIVEPGLDEELTSNNYQVNIYRARPVVIVDGSVQQLVMSAYQTPKQIAAHAGITLRDEDEATLGLSSNILRDGASERMSIDRAAPVRLTLYGKAETVYTQAEDVEAFMKEKGITLGPKDDVSRDLDDEITENMKLSIWRNGKQTITKEEPINFEIETIQDPSKESSYKKINTTGKNGKKLVTYEIVMRNGREVSRKTIQQVVTEKAVKQVQTVGTKFNYTGGPLSDKQINALGQCESGMTATRNSGNGFYGAFQFMPQTWSSVAPDEYKSVLPHQAPLNAQKQAVQNLLSGSSIYNQFPGCARKMQAQGII